MNKDNINFIQQNSPDGGFLQSDEWRKFQEAVGRKTYGITGGDVDVFAIEHSLPLVGSYLYTPRWPVIQISNLKFQISNQIPNPNEQILKKIQELITLAKDNNIGWIRIDPANEEVLELIKENVNYKTIKAPHDMQPREILMMDITKPEEQLLSEMKSKTRYNIKLAEKKEVRIKKQEVSGEYIDEFIRLTKIMAKRQGIIAHAESYYKKMIEIIPESMLKLYVAEHDNKIIAANLVVLYGNTCTYLHGASDDDYKNVMAPYLLQWRQIQAACIAGCGKYDLGGVKTGSKNKEERRKKNSWEGITRFKVGFSPKTNPVEFPGSWDIIISPSKYFTYRTIQKMKNIF
jgi:peptidoglycan pentaglycine glycine transferase (the first glycine)